MEALFGATFPITYSIQDSEASKTLLNIRDSIKSFGLRSFAKPRKIIIWRPKPGDLGEVTTEVGVTCRFFLEGLYIADRKLTCNSAFERKNHQESTKFLLLSLS